MAARLLAGAIAVAIASPAAAEPPRIQNVVSYTMYAEGYCNSVEHVPMFNGGKPPKWFLEQPTGNMLIQAGPPMPDDHDLWVIGAWLEVEFFNLSPNSHAWAMSGIANGVGGDYLLPYTPVKPDGKILMQRPPFPAGYAMLLHNTGDLPNYHVDMHVWCPGPPFGASTPTWFARLSIDAIPVQP